MTFSEALRLLRRPAAVGMTAAVLSTSGALIAVALTLISQKGREFHPADITIRRGETIQIVNDDGDLLHHVYIDSRKFSFDSGDQEPGTKTDITFPATGDYDVLCAIHPKMKLVVHVQ
jgi:plastocyanin